MQSRSKMPEISVATFGENTAATNKRLAMILDYRQTNTRYPGTDEVMSALESILDDRVRYQTDGSDYKLTYSDAQTCLDITKFAPALVDVAGCPTFGFWSVGAKDW